MTHPTGGPPTNQDRDPGEGIAGVRWSWVLVAILAIAIALMIGWWLWQSDDGTVPDTRSTSLGAILEEPDSLVGDRVVVSGLVARLLTENAMTLGNDFVDGQLLVLTPPGAFVDRGGDAAAPGVAGPGGGDATVAPFLEGQFIQVTGIVRTFDAEAMTQDYGLVLAPELFASFEGSPAVITEVFDIAIDAPQLAPSVEQEEVDVATVLAEPERFAGQTVRVKGGFGEIMADNVFTLGGTDGEDGLLIVGEDTGGFDEVEPGRPVRVEGMMLGFDAEALLNAGVELGEDIDTGALEGRPTVIPAAVEVLDADEASPAADGAAVVTPRAS